MPTIYVYIPTTYCNTTTDHRRPYQCGQLQTRNLISHILSLLFISQWPSTSLWLFLWRTRFGHTSDQFSLLFHDMKVFRVANASGVSHILARAFSMSAAARLTKNTTQPYCNHSSHRMKRHTSIKIKCAHCFIVFYYFFLSLLQHKMMYFKPRGAEHIAFARWTCEKG